MCKKVKFPKLCELKKLEEKEDEGGKKNRREQKKICFTLVKSHKSSMQEKTLLQEKKNKRCHKEIKANNIYVWAFFKKKRKKEFNMQEHLVSETSPGSKCNLIILTEP